MGGEQLKINYNDGSSRVVNLPLEFFTTSSVMNHKTKKLENWGPVEKAKDLALSYGNKPVSIVLTQGGNILFQEESKIEEEGEKPFKKTSKEKLKKIKKSFLNKVETIRCWRLVDLLKFDLGLKA